MPELDRATVGTALTTGSGLTAVLDERTRRARAEADGIAAQDGGTIAQPVRRPASRMTWPEILSSEKAPVDPAAPPPPF